jgi:hypothetical protein
VGCLKESTWPSASAYSHGTERFPTLHLTTPALPSAHDEIAQVNTTGILFILHYILQPGFL